MSDITLILQQLESGQRTSSAELLPLVYDELRKLASARLANEKPGQTLQATALVHDAFVRLVDSNQAQRWDSRRHFFGAAAEAMRRILIEQARKKRSLKAGGDLQRIELTQVDVPQPGTPVDLLALDEALAKLEHHAPRKAELVKLRYFAGMTIPEAAKALDISRSTADADWAYAKGFLKLEMSKG